MCDERRPVINPQHRRIPTLDGENLELIEETLGGNRAFRAPVEAFVGVSGGDRTDLDYAALLAGVVLRYAPTAHARANPTTPDPPATPS